MSPCHNCGAPYDESFPDWTICRPCFLDVIPEDSYVDSLGIVWSPSELADAGGQAEVDMMAFNSDARNKVYGK